MSPWARIKGSVRDALNRAQGDINVLYYNVSPEAFILLYPQLSQNLRNLRSCFFELNR